MSCSTRLPYEFTSRKQNTGQIARFRCYLDLCTLDLKKKCSAKWSNCTQIGKFIHYAQETKFSWQKIWLVQNVQNSVSCTVVSMKYVPSGSSCTKVLHLVHHISLEQRKAKTPWVWHYECTFGFSVQNFSNQVLHLRQLKVLYLTHYEQESTFPWHTSAGHVTLLDFMPIQH